MNVCAGDVRQPGPENAIGDHKSHKQHRHAHFQALRPHRVRDSGLCALLQYADRSSRTDGEDQPVTVYMCAHVRTCTCTVGPLIIESTQTKNQVCTGVLYALDDLFLVQTKFRKNTGVTVDTTNHLWCSLI